MSNLWHLADFPPSEYMTQSHFIVGNHARIETHVWLIQEMIDPVNILLLERLRRQVMYSALQKKVLPWGKVSRDQANSLRPRLARMGVCKILCYLWYLIDCTPSQKVKRSHFIMESYGRIETHAWVIEKGLVSSAFPILRCLRCPESSLFNSYQIEVRGKVILLSLDTPLTLDP